MGARGEATTLLVSDQMKDGQKAGLCLMGKQYNLIGLVKSEGRLSVFADINGKLTEAPVNAAKIYLQVQVTSENGANRFYYSSDNKKIYTSW